jgi:hypothetical protein
VLHYAGAGLFAGLAGCATLVHGTRQTVPITSVPAGAPVTIDGVPVGVTPYMARLSRRDHHRVLVGTDSTSMASFEIGRRPSAWLIPELFLYPFILVDLISGAGLALTPATVSAGLGNTAGVAAAPAAPDTTTYWGLSRGHHLRLSSPFGHGALVDATLDSLIADRLYWKPTDGGGAYKPPPLGSALADIRSLQVRRPPSYGESGRSTMHYATQFTWAVPLLVFAEIGSQQRGFKGGAIASAIAIPVTFVAGAAFARQRWAPFESHRVGSPLLVNDQVRLRQLGSAVTVSGRLMDVEPRHLVIRVGPETYRVLRTNVVSLERADGFDLRSRALYGAVTGAMLAYANMGTCTCRPSGADVYTVPITGALMGLLLSPALAPRRWRSVSSW